jgi:predicted HTH transcriptional regulator
MEMTKRDFNKAIIEYFTVNSGMQVGEFTSEQLIEHAQHEIELLDKRNTQRSSKPSKRTLENEPVKTQILEVLTEPMTASQVSEKLEISTQKASSLLRQLVEEGKLSREEIRVAKKGKQFQYALITE